MTSVSGQFPEELGWLTGLLRLFVHAPLVFFSSLKHLTQNLLRLFVPV
jgi:hypothetical protein